MLYGGPVKSLGDIRLLRRQGFDFGEIAIPNAAARYWWWESGIRSHSFHGLLLIAHGPLEGPPDDVQHLWTRYFPALLATVDSASRMDISVLTVHLSVDSRFVSGLVLAEKRRALKKLVNYGHKCGVVISLENLSESPQDLEAVMADVPELALTLDVGHGQLSGNVNTSFEIIKNMGSSIRNVHLHDNRGGSGQKDDLHLPIGEGVVDFHGILSALARSGYDGTLTLELTPRNLLSSRDRIQWVVEDISRQHLRSGQPKPSENL